MKKFVVFTICYLLTYSGLATKLYLDRSEIDIILTDPVEISASIESAEEVSKLKKGFDVSSYRITYIFDSGGNDYRGVYELSKSSYEKYLGKTSIDVTYNSANPNLNIPKSSISSYSVNGTFKEKLFKLLIFSIVVALIPYTLMSYIFGWNTKKETK